MHCENPIIVAVTGHRRLAQEELTRVRRETADALAELIQRAGTPEGLLMLNALAIGADSLVFDLAHALDIPVAAVLPLPREEYEKDFAFGAERDAFRQRLTACQHVWQPDTALSRPACYVQLGMTLVAHADILLALWDGVEDGAPGGASDVVRMAKSKRREVDLDVSFGIQLSRKWESRIVHIDVSRR